MSNKVSTWAFGQHIQPSGRKFVLIALANHSDEHGFCCVSTAHLAKLTAQHKRTVVNHLSHLERDGILKRETRWYDDGGQAANGYWLIGFAQT
jgi:DNA-binding transcriptional ArsR family regulator